MTIYPKHYVSTHLSIHTEIPVQLLSLLQKSSLNTIFFLYTNSQITEGNFGQISTQILYDSTLFCALSHYIFLSLPLICSSNLQHVQYFPAHKTHFLFPKKMWPKFNLVLCAKGKYYFQTYKYLYPHRVKTTMKMILVAVMMIFWVSMMNKLYYGC